MVLFFKFCFLLFNIKINGLVLFGFNFDLCVFVLNIWYLFCFFSVMNLWIFSFLIYKLKSVLLDVWIVLLLYKFVVWFENIICIKLNVSVFFKIVLILFGFWILFKIKIWFEIIGVEIFLYIVKILYDVLVIFSFFMSILLIRVFLIFGFVVIIFFIIFFLSVKLIKVWL